MIDQPGGTIIWVSVHLNREFGGGVVLGEIEMNFINHINQIYTYYAKSIKYMCCLLECFSILLVEKRQSQCEWRGRTHVSSIMQSTTSVCRNRSKGKETGRPV